VHNYPKNGAYVHGILLEGAAWELGAPGQEGYLIEQRPKELHSKMLVINVISVELKNKRVADK
jgi:dynein heavy chain